MCSEGNVMRNAYCVVRKSVYTDRVPRHARAFRHVVPGNAVPATRWASAHLRVSNASLTPSLYAVKAGAVE